MTHNTPSTEGNTNSPQHQLMATVPCSPPSHPVDHVFGQVQCTGVTATSTACLVLAAWALHSQAVTHQGPAQAGVANGLGRRASQVISQALDACSSGSSSSWKGDKVNLIERIHNATPFTSLAKVIDTWSYCSHCYTAQGLSNKSGCSRFMIWTSQPHVTLCCNIPWHSMTTLTPGAELHNTAVEQATSHYPQQRLSDIVMHISSVQSYNTDVRPVPQELYTPMVGAPASLT